MGIGKLAVPFEDLARHLDFAPNHVLVNFDVPRLLMQPHAAYDLVDICGSGTRVVDNFGGTGNFLKNMKLRFDFLRLMVDQHAEFPFFFTRTTTDDENGDSLGKRACDWVDDVMPPCSVRNT